MARIIRYAPDPMDGGRKEPLGTARFDLRNNRDKRAKTALAVLKVLGITVHYNTARAEIARLLNDAIGDGVVFGRLSMRLPEDFGLVKVIRALGTVCPYGVSGIHCGRQVQSALESREGNLSGPGRAAEVEFRILPCPDNYYERRRTSGGRQDSMLMSNERFAEYVKTHRGLDVQYASPTEVILAAMSDRIDGVDPCSHDFVLAKGYYGTRVTVWSDRRRDHPLIISSRNGEIDLVTKIGLQGEEDWRCGTVASVGLKTPVSNG